MAASAAEVGVVEEHAGCPAQVRVPALVGRDREREQLGRALVEPCVVLVEGGAGVGKSRLVRELLAVAPDRSRFAVGACPPFRESPTLGPIVEALRSYRDTVAGLELTPLAGALRGLFPEWAAHLPPAPEPLTEPSAVQHRLFRALAELVDVLDLTALVVEDVHWTDPATIEFLLFLLGRAPRSSSVVITYRPEDVAAGCSLLRLSARLPGTADQRRVQVRPLDVAGTAAMVSSMLDGHPVVASLARLLHQQTDGIPLALEESVRLLCDRAELVRRTGGWSRRSDTELPVPPTVRDAVLERVQRLDDAAHRVMQACAVLGEPVDESVVVAVAGLTGDSARAGLTRAIGCGLLQEDPQARLGFRHVLPRRAVYEAIPAMERRRLHQRAGHALAARAVPYLGHDPTRAARAMAFLGAPFIGGRPRAVHLRWLRRAGQVDLREVAPAERLALTIDRASGLLALGEEAGWAVATQIPVTATRLDERLQVTRGHLNVGALSVVWGFYARAGRRLTAALRLADADRYLRIRDRILVAMARLDWCTGAWAGLAERLAELTPVDGDDPVGYLRDLRHGQLCLARGDIEQGEQRCRQVLDVASRVGAVDDLLEPAAALSRSRLLAGEVDEALKLTDGPMQLVETKGIWVWATDIAPVRVQALVTVGDHGDAAALVSRFEAALAGSRAPAARAALATCRAWLAHGRDEHELAAHGFGESAAAWQRLPRPYEGALSTEHQARCLLLAGQAENAVALLARAQQQLGTLGAGGDVARVAALRRHHAAIHRRWRRGRRGYGDQLSPRELEVVRLLVTGATNREIAHALCRSPKTIAGQLSSAMRKLDVSSRTALAVAAVDAGLVPDGTR